MVVSEFLYNNRDLQKTAVLCGEKSISYRELYERAYCLGKTMKSIDSDVVLIDMPNGIEYVVAYFSVYFGEKIAYPISSQSKGDEINSAIERTNCGLILTVFGMYEEIKNCIKDERVKIICIDTFDFVNKEQEIYWSRESMGEETCLLLNTSGSTSRHKIVMLSNKNIVTNCKDWVDIALEPKKHGNVLVSMPVSTSFGTIIISTCIMLGWTIVFLPSFFNIPDFMNTIEKKQITHLISIGSTLNILAMNIKRLEKSNYNTDSLIFIGVGGNGAVPETMKTLMTYFKHAGLSPGYGITESTCMVATITPTLSMENKEMFEEKIRSAGKPFKHCELNIFADGKYTKKPNIKGEITISGPVLMKGYRNNPEETKKAIRNGYLHTGDIGYIDEDGYLYIIGREKNIIKSGGYTVFPEEIEAVLINSSYVSDVVVYGEKDDLLDELVVANVVASSLDIKEQFILDYCQRHLAQYKIPKKINFVHEIEKTKNGKIKRKIAEIGEKR